jgi:hypothetical protein
VKEPENPTTVSATMKSRVHRVSRTVHRFIHLQDDARRLHGPRVPASVTKLPHLEVFWCLILSVGQHLTFPPCVTPDGMRT